jgi:hypothetical protein
MEYHATSQTQAIRDFFRLQHSYTHADHLTAIACSPDGKIFAVASKEVIIVHTLARKLD